MHRAQEYLRSSIFPGTPSIQTVTSRAIATDEANRLANSLRYDAISYLYSASISFGDALLGIDKKLFTWATVKLYYSTFYALRAMLGFDGVCLFYIGKKPFSIHARAGEIPYRKQGQTHKVVLDMFGAYMPGHFLLSQPIGSEEPLDWLMEKREAANYKNARFVEPDVPEHFESIVAHGIRASIQSYASEKLGYIFFDPDHAMVSYPFKSLQFAYSELKRYPSFEYSKQEMKFLKSIFQDRQGPVPELYKMIE